MDYKVIEWIGAKSIEAESIEERLRKEIDLIIHEEVGKRCFDMARQRDFRANKYENLRDEYIDKYTDATVERDMWKWKAKTYAFWLTVWIVFTVVLTFISILKII